MLRQESPWKGMKMIHPINYDIGYPTNMGGVIHPVNRDIGYPTNVWNYIVPILGMASIGFGYWCLMMVP